MATFAADEEFLALSKPLTAEERAQSHPVTTQEKKAAVSALKAHLSTKSEIDGIAVVCTKDQDQFDYKILHIGLRHFHCF